MSESSPNPAAEDDEWANFDLREFVRATIRAIEFGDMFADVLENRVIRFEECLAARWPRRWLLWRRLRREIRASVATWDDEYIPRGDFKGRRMEWAMQVASDRYDRRGWKPRFAQGDQPGQDAPGNGSADPAAGFLP